MRQWGAVVAAAVLIPLVACSPPHVGPVQYNPLPAALALWKDFPAGQDPRPIVWLGNASPVNGFSTPEAWESAACGFFTLNAPFPTDYSTYSVVTGPDNESGSYLTIPAGEALWALSRGKGQTGPGSGSGCGATAPLVISAVRLGSFAFDTDRGKLEIPAWLFTATGASGDLAYPAIAPIAFWNRGMSTDSFTQTVAVGADGRSLTYRFRDPPGACEGSYVGVVAESSSAVALWIRDISTHGETCMAPRQEHVVRVTLASPLGGRVVVSDNGYAVTVCPATDVEGC